MKRTLTLLMIGGASLIGCQETEFGTGTQSSKIPSFEDRKTIFPNGFEKRLDALFSTDDIGKRFNVPENRVPYPDTYWPMIDDGIAVQWLEKDGSPCSVLPTEFALELDPENGVDVTPDDEFDAIHFCDDPQPSPLEKYMSIFDPQNSTTAVNWESRNHGKGVPGVASWFGHCPGWAASATVTKPIEGPTFARADGKGGVEPCSEGEAGCVRFEIGDINALQSEVFNNARANFIGARCDTKLEDIEFDENGRPLHRGCDGVNAGAYAIILANSFKVEESQRRPFIIDFQQPETTDQIWNQPTIGVTVNRFFPVDETTALFLIRGQAMREDRGGLTDYDQINPDAVSWALLDTTLHWVTETAGPNRSLVKGTDSEAQMRTVAIIELNEDGEIDGGEYLDDPSVGADRLTVAPFIWTVDQVGPDASVFDPRPGHNPFVKSQNVLDLVDIALGQGEGRATGRRGGKSCDQVLTETLSCLQAGTQRVSCLVQLGGSTEAGLQILRDCDFI